LQFADPKAVEDYLDALLGKTPSSVGLIDDAGQRTGASRTEQVLDATTQILAKSIRANPGTPDEVIQVVENVDTQNSAELRNWMARHNEGILKLPVANAAFTLADLQVHVDKRHCSCRAAQADVLIDAFSTANFVSLDTENLDEVSAFAADVMFQKGISWRRRRQAVAGQAPNRTQKSLVQSFKNQISVWEHQGDQFVRQAEEALEARGNQFQSTLDNIEQGGDKFLTDLKTQSEYIVELVNQEDPDRQLP
jgi:hypothetical protein